MTIDQHLLIEQLRFDIKMLGFGSESFLDEYLQRPEIQKLLEREGLTALSPTTETELPYSQGVNEETGSVLPKSL